MASPLADLKEYLLPELGQLTQEYTGDHFRHKGPLSLWTRDSSDYHYLPQYKGVDGPPTDLTRDTAPKLWAIQKAMKEIEAIDPNFLATVPMEKVPTLHKPFTDK